METQSLIGKTAVITGASSGIGKAIALTLAREGANLVLASRGDSVLQRVASECESLGGSAVAVKTDITDPDEVEALLERAIAHFESVDIWINNAGVSAVGEFIETPLDVHEQVIKTNLFGSMYGLYVALNYFKLQKKGIIFNTISAGSFVPGTLASAYSASKFGLRALSEAVKAELIDYPKIHVCDLHPSFVDTPGVLHLANYTGHEVNATPPLYDPFLVAERVLKLIHNPRPSTIIGVQGKIARLAHAVAPNLLEKSMFKSARTLINKMPRTVLTHGNLFSPSAEGTTARGGHLKEPSSIKAYFSRVIGLESSPEA